MERNHRKLQELGLVESKQVRWPTHPIRSPKKAVKRVLAPKPIIAVRKSLRARKGIAPVYAEDAVGFDDDSNRGRNRPRRSCTGTAPPTTGERDLKRQNQTLPLAEVIRARTRESKPLPPDSSRNLECDIPLLVEEYLGRSFPAFGKAPVMELCTKSRPPKMSGVTEWKNAIFLWVNVDEGGGYANLFEGSLPAAAVGGTRVTDIASEGPPKHAVVRQRVADIASQGPPTYAAVVGQRVTDTASDDPPKCAVIGEKETAQGPGNPKKKRKCTTGGLAGDREEGGCTVDASLAELRMTWYAGGRMAPESALIQRLLQCSETEKAAAPAVEAEVGSKNRATSSLLAQAQAQAESSGPHKHAKNGGRGSSRFAAAEAAAEAAAGEPAVVNVASFSAVKSGTSAKTSPTTSPTPTPSTEAIAKQLGTDRADAAGQPERDSSSSNSSSKGQDDAVLLFCRLPKEPYVFCGRLGYAEHWPAERPLRFIWRLLDAGKLALQPDFGKIVNAAGI
ncbi:unnamed protein product, partial [Laminaria digitata]